MSQTKIAFFTDDDGDDLDLMQEIATSLGHSSKVFYDGAQLLAILKSQEKKPDMIFLDINMPKVDGIEVLRELRSIPEYNSIPIIIHTGTCDDKCIKQCLDLGADSYITKSNTYQSLKKSLEYAFNKDYTLSEKSSEDFMYVHA